MSDRTVVFVCLHGAAKSLIAATLFQRLADERGLAVRSTFAGTEPDPAIQPNVVARLLEEGVDVRPLRPRRVTRDELASAWRVVSFGCDLTALAPDARIERWDDVPAVSEDGARPPSCEMRRPGGIDDDRVADGFRKKLAGYRRQPAQGGSDSLRWSSH